MTLLEMLMGDPGYILRFNAAIPHFIWQYAHCCS
jgi:hypothetical protein